MEYNTQSLITVILILLQPLFKNFNWERFEFTDYDESITHEQSLTYIPIKQVKQRRQTELTLVSLKQYKGFENINETEAEKQIDFIKRMAKVIYYMNRDEQKQNS